MHIFDYSCGKSTTISQEHANENNLNLSVKCVSFILVVCSSHYIPLSTTAGDSRTRHPHTARTNFWIAGLKCRNYISSSSEQVATKQGWAHTETMRDYNNLMDTSQAVGSTMKYHCWPQSATIIMNQNQKDFPFHDCPQKF